MLLNCEHLLFEQRVYIERISGDSHSSFGTWTRSFSLGLIFRCDYRGTASGLYTGHSWRVKVVGLILQKNCKSRIIFSRGGAAW